MSKLPAPLIAAALAVAGMTASAADSPKPDCAAAEGTAAVSSVGNLAGGAGGGAAAASYAKGATPPAGMPNRISMNVTVPKQTQGATFGEKVNQGLHAAGGAVAQGAAAAPDAVPGCTGGAANVAKEHRGASDASAGAGAAGAEKVQKVVQPDAADTAKGG